MALQVTRQEKEEEDHDDNIQVAQQKKSTGVQRKYFETLHEIFTELDLTEFDQDGDNCIDLDELKSYFRKNNLSVPDYLAENIFYSIDNDRNGKIIPIEYLKWKMNVTVDDLCTLSEVCTPKYANKQMTPIKQMKAVVPANKPFDDDRKNNDDDMDSDDMDISLDDDGLFGILDEMEKNEEKAETEKLLKNMEIENEKKRIEREKHLKQKQIEDQRRREYAEEQRKKQQEISALKLKLAQKEAFEKQSMSKQYTNNKVISSKYINYTQMFSKKKNKIWCQWILNYQTSIHRMIWNLMRMTLLTPIGVPLIPHLIITFKLLRSKRTDCALHSFHV